MPLDAQAGRLMAMLGAGRRTDWPALTAAERRAGFAALMRVAAPRPAGAPAVAVAIAGASGPLSARLYAPEGGPTPGPGLVYFHGGGLVAGDLDTHDGLCRALAAGAGCRVLSVAYRLAPEHRFPTAAEDATASLADALDRACDLGLDAARVAAGGDSAGATLSVLATHALRRRDGPRPALLFLLCPVLDMVGDAPSRRLYGEGYLLDAGLMARDLADYAPGVAPDDPRLSPLRAPDLAGLPPALIHTAEFDPLRDEGALFAGRLAAAGVPVEHRCHGGMIHHFYGLTGLVPAARTALAGIAEGLGHALSRRGAATA